MPVYLLIRNYLGDKDRRAGGDAVVVALAKETDEQIVREIASQTDKREMYRSDWLSPLASTCQKLDTGIAVIGRMTPLPELLPVTEPVAESSDINAVV